MAHIVVLGAGIAGLPCAYELRERLGSAHRVTLVNERADFQFVPSNPWMAVGWRDRESITFDLGSHLGKKGIGFVACRCERIDPGNSRLEMTDGVGLDYDFLVIATGPSLAFDEVEGAGPDGGHTHSVCTVDHAAAAYRGYQALLREPGRVIIGALPYASCFGPAYEFAFILDADLRKRKLRDRVPITFVTPEPYVGHLGLAGVDDSRALLESEFRDRDIAWIANARVTRVEPGSMAVEACDDRGAVTGVHALAFSYSVMLPAFKGVETVAAVEGLCDSRGFVLVDPRQRSTTYPTVYAAGVCTSIPAVEATPVPTGAPKTGYMTESMVKAVVHNIADELAGREPSTDVARNAICLADMGDTGAAFLAFPQLPPRELSWFKTGKWVHMAKIAFEKYFLRKMKRGTTERIYEKYILKLLGVEKLE